MEVVIGSEVVERPVRAYTQTSAGVETPDAREFWPDGVVPPSIPDEEEPE